MADKFLIFHNDASYIRVENQQTNVTSFFSKDKIVMQCDESTSFFLKSDSYQQYFMYENVLRPSSTSLQGLLYSFQSWVDEFHRDTVDTSVLTSDLNTTLIEVKTYFDKDPMRIDELIVGTATSVFDGGKNAVRLSLPANDKVARAVRQTKMYAPINNNKLTYSVVGAILISDVAAKNVLSRAGPFDDGTDISEPDAVPSGNGIFFQFDSVDGLSMVLRSNITGSQVDAKVKQADWSMDHLNGTGPSGYNLDPTKEQTFVFEWSALKGHVIRAGVLHAGLPIFCHKFVDARMGCPSVPLRWELGRVDANSADADAASAIQTTSSTLLQGSLDAPRFTRGYSTGAMMKPLTKAESPMPVFSIRLRAPANRAHVYPRRLRLMNLEVGVAKWTLMLNPTLVNPAFVDLGNGSFAQVSADTDATASGGIALATGFFTEAATQTIDLDKDFLPLCADIKGKSDVLTLVVEYLRGAVSVSAAIEWMELE